MKRYAIIILLSLSIAGCASASTSKKLQSRVDDLEMRLRQQQQIIIEQEEMISQRDKDMRKLQMMLQEQERLLREKEEKVIQLRKRLEGFGVFE